MSQQEHARYGWGRIAKAISSLGKGETRMSIHSFPSRFSRSFPPDLSLLLSLGFEQLSSSSDRVLIRKIESSNFAGKPHLFTEVEIRRKSVVLRYSMSDGQDAGARHLQSCMLMLRVLSLVRGLEAESGPLCAVLLPAMETSSLVSASGFPEIFAKVRRLQSEAESLRARNRKLLRTCSEETELSVELRRQIFAFRKRVSQLEAVSDSALCGMVQEWVASHRGIFSAASFSQQHGIPPSRAQEGLEMLLKSGAVQRLGGALRVHQAQPHQEFEVQKTGARGALSSLFRRLSKQS